MKDIEELRKEAVPIRLMTGTVDGRKIGYSSVTEFLVQIGRGPKGSYRTKYRIVGNLTQAIMYYTGINIGRGYKKRLLMPSCSKKPVVDKQTSFPFVRKSKKVKPESPLLARQTSHW